MTFTWYKSYHLVVSNKYTSKKGEYMGDISSASEPMVFTELSGLTISSTTGNTTIEKTATITNDTGAIILGILNYF